MARTAENRYGSCWSGLPLVRLSITYKKKAFLFFLYIYLLRFKCFRSNQAVYEGHILGSPRLSYIW